MSRRDPIISMRHMLDHAREAVAFARGRSRADLDSDRLLSLALTRLVQIVGEAAGRVPPEACARYPGIEWRQISDARNRLVHGYDAINLDTVWDIIVNDLPPLIAELESILSQGEDPPASGAMK
jgi:uncharacterized protein with HEPN domain